jgi:hypothetical protein
MSTDKKIIAFVRRQLNKITKASEEIKRTNAPLSRRLVLALSFATYEAAFHLIRNMLREKYSEAERRGKLNQKERRALGEDRRIITLDRFLATITAAQKLNGKKFEDPRLVPWFGSFETLVKVRHRVTHPRTTTDTNVSEAEVQLFAQGTLWLFARISDAF